MLPLIICLVVAVIIYKLSIEEKVVSVGFRSDLPILGELTVKGELFEVWKGGRLKAVYAEYSGAKIQYQVEPYQTNNTLVFDYYAF